jgi:hypothetical protein
MALTDIWLRNAKGKAKPYKKGDSGQLYILVMTNGNRLWRMNYTFQGKQKTLALGRYPLVSLVNAREARDAAKRLLLEGIDPGQASKAKSAALTFEMVARIWHTWKVISERYSRQVLSRLERDVFPEIGSLPMDEIEPPTQS